MEQERFGIRYQKVSDSDLSFFYFSIYAGRCTTAWCTRWSWKNRFWRQTASVQAAIFVPATDTPSKVTRVRPSLPSTGTGYKTAVFQIRIVLRRIRIRRSVPLDYESGSFCSFHQWLLRYQQKIVNFQIFFAYFLLEAHLPVLLIRIRIRRIHMFLVLPDPGPDLDPFISKQK